MFELKYGFPNISFKVLIWGLLKFKEKYNTFNLSIIIKKGDGKLTSVNKNKYKLSYISQ